MRTAHSLILTGAYARKADAHGRLPLPWPLKDGILHHAGRRKTVLVVAEKDVRYVMLMQPEGLLSFPKDQRPDPAGDMRDASGTWQAKCWEVAVDARGRIRLDRRMKEQVGAVDRAYVFVGVGDWVELWSHELWEEQQGRA